MKKQTECETPSAGCSGELGQLSRRHFLFGSGAALLTLTLPTLGESQVLRSEYPRKKIGNLSQLKSNQPQKFRYPWDHVNAENFLIRLSEPAGGGVGPESNVVAFNSLCTHQGARLDENFDGKACIAGPCYLHWTTFDLTRHGMVISGHATAGLPQILLETEGDEIYAVGIQGLIFGYANNHQAPA
ncbi:arsenate reductase (azurin) small subunit [Gimesia sp.]|uniref:arsenate reductase (azurin) small subunit n=1 Tax=Gimesia sp. TaxID=2024833 RepID=UPI003A933AEB